MKSAYQNTPLLLIMITNNVLVSIIVPCFNSSNRLFGCLTSLLKQTYSNIEIICVDDGSTDNTSIILKYFSLFDRRVVPVFNTNHGVSYSRNVGLEKCSGEYICFVDSDDYVSDHYIEELLKNIIVHNSDLVICGFETFEKKECFIPVSTSYIVGVDNAKIIRVAVSSMFLNPPWNKIFKKSLIYTSFNERFSLGEDIIFVTDYLMKSKKVSFLDKSLYFYNTDGSQKLTKKFHCTSFEAILTLYERLSSFCDNDYCKEDVVAYVSLKLIESINSLINSDLSTTVKKQYFYSISTNDIWLQIINNALSCEKAKTRELQYIIKRKFWRFCSFYFFMKIKRRLGLKR